METIEKLFSFINDNAQKIEKEQELSYLDSVLEVLNAWLDGDNVPAGKVASKEDIRKAIQLAILKGMRENAQPNHQMTPDALGLLVGYFVEQFMDSQEKDGAKIKLLDPAVGTGNLLLTVMNLLQDRADGVGVEIDELLIQLAAAAADLTEQPVSLFRQDALQNLMIDPADAVVCDLPVGYYPNDEVAKEFELKATEGMIYAHHLFIEQSLKYSKDGGYLFFLVPENIFESEQAQGLYKYLQKTAWIQAVIQLPSSLFQIKHIRRVYLSYKRKVLMENL